MSAPKFIRTIATGSKNINVLLAREVSHGGVRRLADLIDEAALDATVERIEGTLKDRKLLSNEHYDATADIVITSMDHSSPMDKDVHGSYKCMNKTGDCIAKGHINTNPDKQQVARSTGAS